MPLIVETVKRVHLIKRTKKAFGRFIIAVLCALAAQHEAVADAERPIGLSQALALVDVRNRDIALAQRAVEGADAGNLAARARPNPVLAVGTSAVHPLHPGAGAVWNKPVDAIAQISQLFERGGKRDLRDQVTRLEADATRIDVQDITRQQRLAATLSYYDLLQAQERVKVADDTLAALARTVAAAQLRLKAGDISPADLARIQVDASRAENERRQALADRDRARAALAFRIGTDREPGALVASDPWPATPVLPDPEQIPARVERRPDVQSAAVRLQEAEKARALARALKTRDVTVAMQYERYPGQDQNNTLGFGVSVPLFLNYHFEGEIRRAEAFGAAAVDLIERTRSAALTEARQAWSDLASARDRVARFDGSLLRDAIRAADAAEFAYRNGALGVIDLLDARRVLNATRVEAVAARADLARAAAAWAAAVFTKESAP